ncbi:E3 ubiquitin-protein ligase RGLG1 [Dichanthelium oligosanthes]|uniref:E3 ubiquitin-protein ligase RGLG1 n=1 Tax=Dichanthelium oligosanthes TaxID=888268 RepID=A0A1E5VI09_9POAL|nr:E3 ubiquitin-protein ligase RGLG1 [Dichanthelium oligosanthes]
MPDAASVCWVGCPSFLIQVKDELEKVGLESSNLIIGVDFTKSNEWTGKRCFDGRSLHHVGNAQNPYEQAIDIIGRTLSAYDEDNRIPCFGFGDSKASNSSPPLCKLQTREVWCSHLLPRASQHRRTTETSSTSTAMAGHATAFQKHCSDTERSPLTFGSLVSRIFQPFRFSPITLTDRPVGSGLGPTSLAPIIETATRIVEDSTHQYHILLIIADAQVPTSTAHPASHPDETRSVNYLEERTLQALIHARY